MPVFNAGKYLKPAVDSILSQSSTDWELLLIDDGSTDDSPRMCDLYSALDNRIRVVHKTNSGICDSRNVGLAIAKGEYIAFCDHDDVYDSRLIETIESIFTKNPGIDLLKYRYQTENENGTIIYTLPKYSHDVLIVDDIPNNILSLSLANTFSTVWSFVYRRSLIEQSRVLFNTDYKGGGEDYDFNIRIMPFVRSFAIIPDILYFHYLRQSKSTSSKPHVDVMYHFLDSISVFNLTLKSIGCDPHKQSVQYLKLVSEKMRGFCSMSAQLKLSTAEIHGRLKETYGSLLIKPTMRAIIALFANYPSDAIFLFLCKIRAYFVINLLFCLVNA